VGYFWGKQSKNLPPAFIHHLSHTTKKAKTLLSLARHFS